MKTHGYLPLTMDQWIAGTAWLKTDAGFARSLDYQIERQQMWEYKVGRAKRILWYTDDGEVNGWIMKDVVGPFAYPPGSCPALSWRM